MRLFFMVRGAFVLLIASCLLRANPTADELIKRVQDRYNAVRTLSVTFVENYSIQGHQRPQESGVLSLRKQGKMRWDYTQPQGKLFVSDGKTVYLYTARDNRVEKIPLKDTEDMRAPLAFLLGRLDMKKDFRDFQVRDGGGGVWLQAAAKNDRTPYGTIEMLVAPDSSIRQLKIGGRDGSLLEFSFTAEKLNPALADALFHFTIPPGAQIVDSVEFGQQEN